jgi:hypothetical protein
MKGSERDPSYEGVKRIVEYLEKTDLFVIHHEIHNIL